jgi:hypothetical protein
VNVKTYGDVLGGLDIVAHPYDYTLVLTGPPRGGSVGSATIAGASPVYLFEMTHCWPPSPPEA